MILCSSHNILTLTTCLLLIKKDTEDIDLCDVRRVSVQGVKSLGGHFACFCRGFEIYEVKKNITE